MRERRMVQRPCITCHQPPPPQCNFLNLRDNSDPLQLAFSAHTARSPAPRHHDPLLTVSAAGSALRIDHNTLRSEDSTRVHATTTPQSSSSSHPSCCWYERRILLRCVVGGVA